VPRVPYPPHWKPGQRLSKSPQSLGDQIRKHRLELHWLQADLAKAVGVYVVSVSNWERGASTPSRRLIKRIQVFLDYESKPVHESTPPGLCAWKCELHETTGQLCLFERICKGSTCRQSHPIHEGQAPPAAATQFRNGILEGEPWKNAKLLPFGPKFAIK
jgi:transcriptional regulator with XRE-family HTH domain